MSVGDLDVGLPSDAPRPAQRYGSVDELASSPELAPAMWKLHPGDGKVALEVVMLGAESVLLALTYADARELADGLYGISGGRG